MILGSVKRKDPYLEEAINGLNYYYERADQNLNEAYSLLSKTEADFVNDEITHCVTDARYYLENYHVINTESEGLKTLFPLWEAQEILHDKIAAMQAAGKMIRIIILKARQEGLSTYVQGRLFHASIFREARNTIVVAQDPDTSDHLFGMSRLAYDYLPWWMRPEERYNAKGKYLVFDRKDALERQTRPGLRSQIICEASNKMTMIAGLTIHNSHSSELALWYNAQVLSQGLFPMMNAPDGLYFLESTAKGRNTFWHRLWKGSIEGKTEWTPVFIEWFRVKKYTEKIPPDSGFTLTPAEVELKARVLEESKVDLSNEQLYWRRLKIATYTEVDGDEWKFFEQYPCLAGSTLVSGDDGIIPIEQTPSGENDSGKITAWAYKGERAVVRVETALGYSVDCTPDHVFPTTSGDVMAKDLTGFTISLRGHRFAKEQYTLRWKDICDGEVSIPITGDFARFLGYFLGDGCYTGSVVSICCDTKDQDVIEDVSNLMEKFIDKPSRRTVGSKGGGTELRVGSKRFKVIMEALGIWNPNGRPHRLVRVPDCIFRSPQYVVREFLRGLMEADGWSGYVSPRVQISSMHREFLKQIQVLLMGFGISSQLRATLNSIGKRRYVGNSLDMRSAESRSFHAQIGFIGNRKHSRMDDIAKLQKFTTSKLRTTDIVISVTPLPDKQRVYDITVEPDHVFSANGILTHNCNWREAFQGSGNCAFDRRKLHKILETTCCIPYWYGEIDLVKGSKTQPRIRLQTTRCKVNGKPEYKPDLKLPIQEEFGGRLRVWELPQKGERYQIGADVAQGILGGDFSCAQILRLGKGPRPDVQVAEWHGYISATLYGRVLAALGYWYNTAMIAPENNDIGIATQNELMRGLEYPNLFQYKHYDKIKNFMTDWLGWYTNSKTRPMILNAFREAMADGSLVLRSADLIEQCFDFASIDGSRYEGQSEHDDRIMAAMITRFTAHDIDWDGNALDGGQVIEDPPKDPSVDYYNTDYSPVHDKRGGVQGRLVHQHGVDAREIPVDRMMHDEMEAGFGKMQDDEDDYWKTL